MGKKLNNKGLFLSIICIVIVLVLYLLLKQSPKQPEDLDSNDIDLYIMGYTTNFTVVGQAYTTIIYCQ